jgi:DNA-nicking Smr family endonuclease
MKKKSGDNNEDSEDEKLWSLMVKDVKPIKKEKPKAKPQENKRVSEPAVSKKEDKITSDKKEKPQHTTFTGIDRNTDKKLKKGKMPIDSRLDLHGLTKVEAYETLKSFIERNYLEGKRNLLIVTGKGSREGTGIIKKSFPIWIQEQVIIQYVLQFYPAQPKDGGDGAFYVLLRRKR